MCVCVYMQRHMYVFYIHILNVVQNDGILALSINRNWTNSNFNRKPKICPLNMSTGKHPDFLSCVDRTQQSLQNRPEDVLTEGSPTSLLFSDSQTSSPNMKRSQEHWTNDKEQVTSCRPSVNWVQGTPSAAHSWYPPSAALAPFWQGPSGTSCARSCLMRSPCEDSKASRLPRPEDNKAYHNVFKLTF